MFSLALGRIHTDQVNHSHYHWDHIGDMRTFPLSTELVVGPGFQETYLPAWPTNPDSPLRDDYFTWVFQTITGIELLIRC